MNPRRFLRAVAVVVAAVAGVAVPAGAEQARGVRVVTTGTVVAVDPAGALWLDDGTVVEIEPGTEWSGRPGLTRLRAGEEVQVIGVAHPAGSGVAIKAGGVRVVSGSGRIAPIGAAVCLPPRAPGPAAKELATAGGVSLRRAAPKIETEIEGTVTALAESSFELRTAGSETFTVLVDHETELRGFGSLGELAIGDPVRARGELEGSVLAATRVELRSGGGDDGGGGDGGGDDGGGDGGGGDDDGVDFESTGLLTQLLPPDRFELSDQRVYRVDGQTVFDDPVVSYAGLDVGQILEVKAVYEGGGTYRAVKVKYEGDDDLGQGFLELEGTVAAVAPDLLTLSDGTAVVLSPTTVFNGDADSASDIEPGWRAEVYAVLNAMDTLIAQTVRAEDPAPSTTVGQEYEPHEAVLVLSAGADPLAVASRHGAEVRGQISSIGVLFVWQREIDDELLAELAADLDVTAVEPNFLFRDPESTRRRFVIVDRSPTASEYGEQAAALRHQVAKALSVSTGAGAVVAVMDTGVDICHPALIGHLAVGGLDLVDGDLSPAETANGIDDDGDGEIDEAAGHGTFTASLVALAAPGARILPYRVLDDDGGGTAFNLALALTDAIDRGVDVINLSLVYRERSVVVDLLLEEASRRGIVVVAAAGNDGSAVLPFPATDSHVLAVTALRADGAGLAEFANRGLKAALAVTGEDVYGGLVGGEWGTTSGTSVAAPFAAAGAALVKSLDPTVSADIVRRLFVQLGVAVSDGDWSGASLDLGRALVSVQP